MKNLELQHLHRSGELLCDFGFQPVSNRFLAENSGDSAPRFPFGLRLRPDCGLVHIDTPFPVHELRPRYSWLTCFEPEDHLDDLVRKIISLPGVDRDSIFAGYSFKDDSTLSRLDALGYTKHWRLDPEQDLGITDPCANVETYQAEFTVEKAERVVQKRGPADVLLVRHVVEHAYDLSRFIDAVKSLVKPGGYVVWEVPDCSRALESGDCTTLWEEHIFYFTKLTFEQVLYSSGFDILFCESIAYPLENSIIAVAGLGKEEGTPLADRQSIQRENDRARRFVDLLHQRRRVIRGKLEHFRSNGRRIALFGAGHLSVAFLSIMGVEKLLDVVIDDNQNKKGLKMPLGDLKIVGSDALYSGGVSLCLLGLNPHNQPKMIRAHASFEENGGIFASIFPNAERYLEETI